MVKEVLIITGGSKGIGLGIATCYARKGTKVYSIARTKSAELAALGVEQIEFDLMDLQHLEALFAKLFKEIQSFEEVQKISMINNAGMLGPIAPLAKQQAKDILAITTLNLTVPMLCTLFFIQQSAQLNVQKSIINISSGAAQKPYFGWSGYCASKAALNLFGQVVALEQAAVSHGVKLVSVAPGVVDTAMQDNIRASNVEDFKDLQRFIDLKEQGKLRLPDEVAEEIYALDHDTELDNGAILRLG